MLRADMQGRRETGGPGVLCRAGGCRRPQPLTILGLHSRFSQASVTRLGPPPTQEPVCTPSLHPRAPSHPQPFPPWRELSSARVGARPESTAAGAFGFSLRSASPRYHREDGERGLERLSATIERGRGRSLERNGARPPPGRKGRDHGNWRTVRGEAIGASIADAVLPSVLGVWGVRSVLGPVSSEKQV